MSSVNVGLICVHAILYCLYNEQTEEEFHSPDPLTNINRNQIPPKGLIISALLYECQAIYHNSILLYVRYIINEISRLL